jgi:hypothetical protein
LNECSHNIIEIQKQIIEFLNQIKYQGNLVEKIRKVKYLKDQFTIRATTDIESLIVNNNAVIFENNPSYPLKLSVAYLQESSEVKESIEKIAKKIKSNVIVKLVTAGTISDEYLENSTIILKRLETVFLLQAIIYLILLCNIHLLKKLLLMKESLFTVN